MWKSLLRRGRTFGTWVKTSFPKFVSRNSFWITGLTCFVFLTEAVASSWLLFGSLNLTIDGIQTWRIVGQYTTVQSNVVDICLSLYWVAVMLWMLVMSVLAIAGLFRKKFRSITLLMAAMTIGAPFGWEHCYVNLLGGFVFLSLLNKPFAGPKPLSPEAVALK